MSKFKKGAGVLVFKNHIDGVRILCLFRDKDKKIEFDLTKGLIDKGESEFQAAVRETYEESGIDNLYYPLGKISKTDENLTFFIALTDQEPNIKPNPKSGEFEHDGYIWMKPEDSEKVLPLNLAQFVLWGYLSLKDVK